MPSRDELKMLQALPLDIKIQKTRLRIREWVDEFGEDGVYVSFSGGKDSTVLFDIVRKDYPNMPAVFVNTGLEYPSVRQFALSKENVTELRPVMNFRDVVVKYGYPIISKEVSNVVDDARRLKDGKTKTMRMMKLNGELLDHDGNKSRFNCETYKFLLNAPFNISDKCCYAMKKKPFHNHEKKSKEKAIIATMAEESRLRLQKWLEFGCNAFGSKKQISKPMSFWTEQDVLTYIHTYNLTIADAYGQVIRDWKKDGLTEGQIDFYEKLSEIDPSCKLPGYHYKTTGCKRTGCIFCGFGITRDKQRFIRLSEQEPKLCDYVMRGGEFSDSGMWQPSKDGLGYWFVLQWLNVHGNLGIGILNWDYYHEKYGTEETDKYLGG